MGKRKMSLKERIEYHDRIAHKHWTVWNFAFSRALKKQIEKGTGHFLPYLSKRGERAKERMEKQIALRNNLQKQLWKREHKGQVYIEPYGFKLTLKKKGE